MLVNPTNNEIDTEIDKLEQSLYYEFSVPPKIYLRLEALIKAKARADERKKIFAELDILFGEGFYSKSMDEKAYKIYQHEYEALKKKYGVD